MATSQSDVSLRGQDNISQNMDISTTADPDEIYVRRAHYKLHGRSFGNKLVVSLPILNAAIPVVFLVASYIYAINNKKKFMPINHNVPFISDIGNEKPESSLFTFGMILSTYCTLGIILIRFLQVQHFLVKFDAKMNNISLVVGLTFILGKILVVSFQLSSQLSAHYIGAGIYVIFSTIYALLQTLISYKNKTLYGKYQTYLLLARVILVVGMILGTLIFGIFLIPSLLKYNREGYSVSQSGEWMFATCKICFMLTFIIDFRPLHPQLLLIRPGRPTHPQGMVVANMATNASSQPVPKSQYERENGTVLGVLKEVQD